MNIETNTFVVLYGGYEYMVKGKGIADAKQNFIKMKKVPRSKQGLISIFLYKEPENAINIDSAIF